MKTSFLLYLAGLLLIAAAFYMLLEHPNSNRMAMYAGLSTLLGFGLNIAGFFLKNSVRKV